STSPATPRSSASGARPSRSAGRNGANPVHTGVRSGGLLAWDAVVGAAGGVPVAVDVEELLAERVVADQRHHRSADRPVVWCQFGGAREMLSRRSGVAVAAQVR